MPLERRPTELLILLVQHQGHVVTTAQIQRHLWGQSDVDVHSGIATAVRKIRDALADDSRNPRFVDTVRGRGYRFMAAVAEMKAEVAAPPLASHEPHEGPARASFSGTPIGVALVALAGIGTTLALTTSAVGSAAAAYGLHFVLLVFGYGHLPDGLGVRAATAGTLFLGMSYVLSAWTLADLVDYVVNFSTVGPAALHPFVTGMQFLPLFALVLFFWVAQAPGAEAAWTRSVALFWALAGLMLALTAAALAGFSGEWQIIGARVPGFEVVAGGFGAVVAVNLAFAQLAFAEIRCLPNGSTRRVLALCAISYAAVSIPAIAVGSTHNAINRHHLSTRRADVYYARHPTAVEHFRAGSYSPRDDIGPDLLELLRDPAFQAVLREQPFYKMDLDERFQVTRRAVTFGYARSTGEGRHSFHLIRFPLDVAKTLGFERAVSPR